ncbi:hypothetical protein [Clostridium sp. AWRP]|uniref:hypothetical protein n=1 Tax=Clostridium sp. AWRP TaxID=2212991 RepID=UPI000FD99AA5|nr:hypothetical protein [Clostridium sp. AWRP]AZV57904.1 hypothetical protein DMR38_15530 [Clostridium sp. AWRP]
MENQICPHCGKLRDMIVSVNEIDEKDEEGKSFKIITNNYHCSVCNTFVYSTDKKIIKDN